MNHSDTMIQKLEKWRDMALDNINIAKNRIKERLEDYSKWGLDINHDYVKKVIDSEKELLGEFEKQYNGYQSIIDGIKEGYIKIKSSK
ncbi:hypothetical protein FDE85_02550 [Clostridium botulinum]|nr:hypothetical protein [Clostridium botulinum]NFR89906.1 hypothetical protein [Clostridium botulinum]NFT97961.1 hypothetical protein [Clostridium botulinum]